jgi:hypothetical protein
VTVLQFIPKSDAQPGDMVRERGKVVAQDQLPTIVRLDGLSGVFVRFRGLERFLPFGRIEAVLRASGPAQS